MPGLLELSKDDTIRALLKRKVCQVRCCEKIMHQNTVYSLLPTEEIPFGRSIIVLECWVCRRMIELELFVGNPDRDEILKAFKLDKE